MACRHDVVSVLCHEQYYRRSDIDMTYLSGAGGEAVSIVSRASVVP